MKALAQSFSAALILTFGAASLTVSATPLSEYNLILLDDLTTNSIHVYDKTFIGGNLQTNGWSEFGSRMDRNTRENSLEVVGNMGGSGVHVQAGYAEFGGNNTLGGVNCNGNGLGGNACLAPGASLGDQATDLANRLYADAQWFAALTGNGSLLANGSNKTLNYTGSDAVAVFNLDGNSLFSQNANWALNAGAAQTVVINVSGSSIANAGGVNMNNGFSALANSNNIGASNILWNFYEATSINFGSMRVNGSVLAPFADITMQNDFDGAVAARSYSGAGQVHNFLFNWTPPTVSVSEPSILLLLMVGLGLIGLVRLRRA